MQIGNSPSTFKFIETERERDRETETESSYLAIADRITNEYPKYILSRLNSMLYQ